MPEDESRIGRQVQRPRLMLDIKSDFHDTVSRSAADHGLSVRDFTVQAIDLRILIDRISAKGWVMDISDAEGKQVISGLPISLLPALAQMDEQLLDVFIKQRPSVDRPGED